MAKRTVKDVDLKGKKALVRVDLNVPLEDGVITNDNHIMVALPTVKYVIENSGRAILLSRLDYVRTEGGKAGKSLKPVAERLSGLLGQPVTFVPETCGKELEGVTNSMKDDDILVFENARSEDVDDKKENGNDAELDKCWASLGDVFIDGAFGTVHRVHVSSVGIASTGILTAAGFLMKREIKSAGEVVENPKRPFVTTLDGAKVSDKTAIIESLVEEADKILIDGGIVYTFMKAQGYSVGLSLLEKDKMDLTKSLMEKADDKLVLPVDTVVSKEFSNDAPFHTVSSTEVPDGEEGLDIDEKIIELFANELQGTKTAAWNGPMGVFEMSNFAKGTIDVCETIINLEDAITIIGDGDSATAAVQLGYGDKFSHISIGGGTSLELLEGKTLPGLASISDK